MRFLDAARSAPLRYALVFAAHSALVISALLAITYWSMTSLLERHVEEAIQQQLSVLRDDLAQDGRDSIVGLVRQHQVRQDGGPVHLLVQDRDGKVLAGDLPPVSTSEGWLDLELPPAAEDKNPSPRKFRGFGAWLDDDTFILVTHDTADLRQTKSLLIRSFAAALVATVVLALVGGLTIGGMLIRRVEDVNRTARAIMDGDLSRRIPVVAGSDELGGLAESLNHMLSRIEDLMDNLRYVTSSIAHDMRLPLGRHRQRLEAACLKPRTQCEYETAINAAIEETDAILMTFDAMLRIAQIDAGTPRARFAPVSLSEVVESVVDAFSVVAEDQGKRLIAQTDPGVTVHGDRELLAQMLVNLVENSLRHGADGTFVEILVQARDGRPRITVSDDGSGIPADERERVFGRFYRLDTSRSTPGSGLGLSFVAAVAKLHDATVSLEDNAPGLRVVVAFG